MRSSWNDPEAKPFLDVMIEHGLLQGSLTINDIREGMGLPVLNRIIQPEDFYERGTGMTPPQQQVKPTKQQLDAFAKKWSYWATCTKPANRPLAERAITLLRRHAGIKTPPIFIWADSPFVGRALCDFLHKRSKTYDLSATSEEIRSSKIKLPDPNSWSAHTDSRYRASASWQTSGLGLIDNTWMVHQHITGSDEWGYHLDRSNLTGKDQDNWEFFGGGLNAGSTARLAEGVEEELWDTIFKSVPKEKVQHLTSSSLLAAHKGQLDLEILRYGLVDRDLNDNLKPSLMQSLRRWEALAKSCQYWWCYKNYVIVSERFERIVLDTTPRLHCTTGPAIRYRDGRCVYAIANVRVPELIIEAPQKITVKMIDGEDNAEVRRHMIDRFRPEPTAEYHGAAAYIKEAGAHRIDHDETYGTLWRRLVPGDEDIVMLEVVNRSPEPEGYFKHYFLRVPPNTITAHEGSAWTFGMSPEDYKPLKET